MQDCWLLGSDAIRVPNVAGAVSGQEDCSHMLRGSTIAIDEPNPLTKYPDVAVTPQALQRVVAADANNLIVDAGPAASPGFPFGWVLGSLDANISHISYRYDCYIDSEYIPIDIHIHIYIDT